jgi:hypothetical protein
VGIVIYSYVVVNMYFKNKDKMLLKGLVSNYIESINTKHLKSALLVFFFLLRRLVTAILYVFWNEYPSLQITALTNISFAFFVYLFANYPYVSLSDNR